MDEATRPRPILDRDAARCATAVRAPAAAGRDPVNLPMIRNWLEALGDDRPGLRARRHARRRRWSRCGRCPACTASAAVDRRPARRHDGGARRGRLHLGGGHQLRRRPTTATCASGEQVDGQRRLERRGRPEADRAGRGLVRHHREHLVRRRRAGGGDAVPGAEVPAAGAGGRPPAGRPSRAERHPRRWSAATPRSSGRARRPASCGSSAAADCGALRHPPGPTVPALRRGERRSTSSRAGTGEVYSYVVHHHPPVPGRTLPFVVALVELEEGVRMLGELRRTPARTRSASALPVRVDFGTASTTS